MLKRYRIGLDVGGLALFILVMLPNFIWLLCPAPQDILRAESKTPVLDTVASVCQAWLVAALCLIRNRSHESLHKALPVLSGVCLALYYISWVAYYQGMAAWAVIVGLTFPPCLALLLYAFYRRNAPAAIPACLFTLLHGAHAVGNFLIMNG